MQKGRKPKPYNLRLLEGNKEHRPMIEPISPPTIIPKQVPRWLDKIAKQEWKRITPILHEHGLLTTLDLKSLEIYCVAYSNWKQAEMKKELGIVKTDSGNVKPNPYIGIAQLYLKELRAICTEFGMTPSSRTRLSSGGIQKQEEDPLDELMKLANG